jgi:FAD/FMN-containing dehydrogenase
VAAVYGSPPRRWHACATRYAIEDDPGAFHTTGWHGVYVSRHSLLAVAAESAADIVVAVDFAREHDTRLVIEGTRHDYLGRSCVSGALLIRTHRMREITVHDAFVPAGPPVGKPGVPAITVGAGT